jgi:hypothetical protein
MVGVMSRDRRGPHPRLKKLILPAFQHTPATQTRLRRSHHANTPSPTNAIPRPPSRVVDDDYDEGITNHSLLSCTTALLHLW